MVMNNDIKKFIKENLDLIQENTKESWEDLYNKLNISIRGQFTKTMLDCGIDPAKILDNIPAYYLAGSDIKHYKISDNIIRIGDRAFYNCDFLTNLIIPSSIMTIATNSLKCKSLKSIIYLGTISDWQKIDVRGDDTHYYSWRYKTLSKIICTDGVIEL